MFISLSIYNIDKSGKMSLFGLFPRYKEFTEIKVIQDEYSTSCEGGWHCSTSLQYSCKHDEPSSEVQAKPRETKRQEIEQYLTHNILAQNQTTKLKNYQCGQWKSKIDV